MFGGLSGKAAAEYALQQKSALSNPAQRLAEEEQKRIEKNFLKKEGGTERIATLRDEMNRTMEKNCGVYRTRDDLQEACDTLRTLRERFDRVRIDDRGSIFNTELTAALELDFMLEVAACIAQSALAREESRGSQARLDFPQRNDEAFLHHFLAYATSEGPRLEPQPVTITRWPPQERKY